MTLFGLECAGAVGFMEEDRGVDSVSTESLVKLDV
jgi:hypothetical protein